MFLQKLQNSVCKTVSCNIEVKLVGLTLGCSVDTSSDVVLPQLDVKRLQPTEHCIVSKACVLHMAIQ